MDRIRDEFLQQMEKSGRAYGHEIRSIANELLRWRAGERVKEEQEREERSQTHYQISLPVADVLDINRYPNWSTVYNHLQVGQTKCVLFRPIGGPVPLYCIIHRVA